MTPLTHQAVGHPTFGDGKEYHACVGGGVCEWCDADDQESSCVDGTDSEQ